MANRRINPRHIKIHYSYTVKDAADALGTHKNTIRLWIKQGLALTDEQCPAMMQPRFEPSWRIARRSESVVSRQVSFIA